MWVHQTDVTKDRQWSVLQGDSIIQGRNASDLSQKTGDCLPTGHPSPSEDCSRSHWHFWLALWWQCDPMTRKKALGRELEVFSPCACHQEEVTLESSNSIIFLFRKQRPRIVERLPRVTWPKKSTDGGFHLVSTSGCYVSRAVSRAWHVVPHLFFIVTLWQEYQYCPNSLGQDDTPRCRLRCNEWLLHVTEISGAWVGTLQDKDKI